MISRSVYMKTRQPDSLTRQLYEQAKDGQSWDPAALDYAVDAEHWRDLDGPHRRTLLALAVLNTGGMHALRRHSAHLAMAIERLGSLEDSLYFSSVIFDFARVTEFCELLLGDIFHLVGDPRRFEKTNFRSFFDEQLPAAFTQLEEEPSIEHLVEALSLHTIIAEGVLSRCATFTFSALLDRLGIMPATRRAIDEQKALSERHLDFAVHFLGKLIQEHPAVWPHIDRTLQRAFEPSVGMLREFFDANSHSIIHRAEVVTYGVEQFSSCYERLERWLPPDVSDIDGARGDISPHPSA